ncbi:hypothetical protein KAH55_02060 [bacterium]|nr:hypothetical protein [bacterium]
MSEFLSNRFHGGQTGSVLFIGKRLHGINADFRNQPYGGIIHENFIGWQAKKLLIIFEDRPE